MADYDNTNTGALFKNNEKQTEKHPDYRGTINVEGTEYWLSAWLKKSKAGTTYMSLSGKMKEEKPAPQKPSRSPADLKDDIPW
jgi:uncharacterized protein (DUF736 family)